MASQAQPLSLEYKISEKKEDKGKKKDKEKDIRDRPKDKKPKESEERKSILTDPMFYSVLY